jgi:putative thioredoxin
MTHFTQATIADFEQVVLDASREKPILVDFWADWCGPCKALDPVLRQIAEELGEQLAIVKVNADEEAGIAAQLSVRGLPTLMLFSDGHPVGQLVGAQPAGDIMALVAPYLSSPADDMIHRATICREQGQLAQAAGLLAQALELEPDNAVALRALIPLRALAGHPDEARELHSRLLRTDRESGWGVALAALIELVELAANAPGPQDLESALENRPDDSDTRAALAARYVMAGDRGQALDQLLQLLRRDKEFAHQLPRRALLAVFELEGEHSDLANEYRRKMAAALH